MAYRALYRKALENFSSRPLLKLGNNMLMRTQAKSEIMPKTKLLNRPSMFSVTALKKSWEVLPIVVFTAVGLTCEMLWTLRLAFTRDDVVYFGRTMPYEDMSQVCKKKLPPVRKLLPLAIIMAAAITGLGYAIVRNTLTRDDIRFTNKGKMLCEKPDENGPRKFLVFNQKYETPKGLAEALAALEEDPKTQ